MLGRALAEMTTGKLAPERPPATRSSTSSVGPVAASLGIVNQTTSLAALSSAGWLFAVVDRISTAVASTEWSLYQRGRRGDERTEVEDHPALALWRRPNEFESQMGFAEVFQQHLELAGDTFWLLVGPNSKVPTELWTLRPDRLTPVPDRQRWLAGWDYRLNGERLFLPREFVVHIRRPSPMDDFRGLSPLGSIFTDVLAERNASRHNQAFFENGAEPGGLLKTEENLDDADYYKLQERWREQHQGVRNAHRVAVLEGGLEWVERKYTMRDMQFEQLRRWSRDLIFGAWGIHASIMGVSEDVNRANAEAAERHFAKWLVRPRLERIKDALNLWVAPLFGEGLEFDYEDPVPEDKEAERQEAIVGSQTHSLTINEIRHRLGEDASGRPQDDEVQDAPDPMQLTGLGGEAPAKALTKDADPANVKPATVDQAEDAMLRSWSKRLEAELDALVVHLEKFDGKRVRLAPYRVTDKIEGSDVDSFDWDWQARYLDDVIAELARAFELALQAELPDMGPERVQLYSSEWAKVRAGELLADHGQFSLAAGTREAVREIVSDAVRDGRSLREIERILRDGYQFSKQRAANVARTETATALGQGQKRAALEQGRDEKLWVSQGDAAVCEVCAPNVSQGWIKVSDSFTTGHDTVPAHPSCRCTVIYRTAAVHADSLRKLAEAFCPAGHLLGKGITEGIHWCHKCRSNYEVRAEGSAVAQAEDELLKVQSRRRIHRDAWGRIEAVEELGRE